MLTVREGYSSLFCILLAFSLDFGLSAFVIASLLLSDDFGAQVFVDWEVSFLHIVLLTLFLGVLTFHFVQISTVLELLLAWSSHDSPSGEEVISSLLMLKGLNNEELVVTTGLVDSLQED